MKTSHIQNHHNANREDMIRSGHSTLNLSIMYQKSFSSPYFQVQCFFFFCQGSLRTVFQRRAAKFSWEVKCLLISTLTGSGWTSSIRQHLVLFMRSSRSKQEARINRTSEMTDEAGPQRPVCGGDCKVSEWPKKEAGLMFSGVLWCGW